MLSNTFQAIVLLIVLALAPGETSAQTLPCAPGERLVEVELRLDAFASEASASMVDVCTGETLATLGAPPGGSDPTLPPDGTVTMAACVDADHEVRIDIYDAFGDGFCCAFGSGWFSVALDGVVAYQGSGFLDGTGAGTSPDPVNPDFADKIETTSFIPGTQQTVTVNPGAGCGTVSCSEVLGCWRMEADRNPYFRYDMGTIVARRTADELCFEFDQEVRPDLPPGVICGVRLAVFPTAEELDLYKLGLHDPSRMRFFDHRFDDVSASFPQGVASHRICVPWAELGAEADVCNVYAHVGNTLCWDVSPEELAAEGGHSPVGYAIPSPGATYDLRTAPSTAPPLVRPSCGLGAELGVLLPLLARRRVRATPRG